MKNGICKGCGASIVWITTAKGKSMPCDATAVYYKMNASGKAKIITPNGVVITCDIVTTPDIAYGIAISTEELLKASIPKKEKYCLNLQKKRWEYTLTREEYSGRCYSKRGKREWTHI